MGRAEKSQHGESFSVNCADPSRRMARLAVFFFSLGLAAAQKGRAIEYGSAIGSGPPQVNFKGKNPNALNVTRVPAKGGVTVGKQGKCNDLEALVNRERGSSGLRPLHCDANMRWVAYQHLDDADEGAQQNLAWGDECNLHSWLVKFPCCYTSHQPVERIIWALRRDHGKKWLGRPENCWLWLPQQPRPLLVRQDKAIEGIFDSIQDCLSALPFGWLQSFQQNCKLFGF